MQICTITCHDVYNVGASLQAYALQTYLSELGHDVRIIDYKPPYLSNHYRFTAVNNSRFDKPIVKQAYLLAKLPSRLHDLPRKWAFDRFRKEKLKLTERYRSYEELKQKPPMADTFFAGSDQIWNPVFPNGKDPAFYLAFVNSGVRASYAASFAVDTFPEEISARTAQWLSQFRYISVREQSGLSILKEMGIDNGTLVLDPVFLLPRKHWSEMAVCPTKSKERYVLVYDFDNSAEIRELAEQIAKDRGLKIYSIFRSSYANRSFFHCGPAKILGLIENADFVLSNSFHATAFSVIFEREFAIVKRTDRINARMKDFADLVGLPDRMVIKNESSFREIDWKDVQCRINEKIMYSKDYIRKVLTRE